jgi:D-glycero-D-manno-heptose 1,7-bisphosphate phosphatase
MTRPAVFLDRDGTIIEDTDFVRDPVAVRLRDGAAASIRRLRDAGFVVVVVTNQSGIARGLLTEADYAAVHARMRELLDDAGARLDAAYMCPHHPDLTGPCACRKPGTLLHRRAAEEHGLDLRASWWVGDRLRDVLPARELGGHGLLIRGTEAPADSFPTVADLAEAADLILRHVSPG